MTLLPGAVLAQDDTYTYYTVQRGDNLFRIALRFGTTIQAIASANGIVNPSLIYTGSVLKIPGPTGGPTTPTTPTTPAQGVYVVVRGDTLFRIALRFGTTVARLVADNGIANPNLIYVGQQLRVDGVPADTTPGDTTPGTMPDNQAPTFAFDYGIQVHLPGTDMNAVAAQAKDLGAHWVKQQIEWKWYEGSRGSIDFTVLDQMVAALEAQGLKILFSVVKAPDWARSTDQENGPPVDFNDYARFVGALAQRYKDRVHAYEIWNEQNLRREWNGLPLSASSYVQLLKVAYTAIKTADPKAIIVSGALAPTGINNGVDAIDDRTYLQQMYAAGLANYMDALGAHPNGWANPPNSVCCDNIDGLTHDDHRSFFFRHTLQDYRQIMLNNGDANTFIWATEFGWGTNADLGLAPVPGYEFVQFTDLNEQATYIVEGFALGKQFNYVGPMFLWNLNFCRVAPEGEQCYWGLVNPNGDPRPAYNAVKSIPK
ncbi:MAG: LysM peptidoglycan-binding domain-containing protein [Anaerolineae bacterium]|nr:LysM peptidoglycan-binding domain-containing protein [Anaerolineae bacterium]